MARHSVAPVVWWARRLLSGHPHQTIGSASSPYLLRWWLIPHNRYANVYVHKYLRSDEARALHDHPWGFWSLVLAGEYLEYTQGCGNPHPRKRWSVAHREATTRHRVALVNGWGRNGDMRQYGPLPCWTLVVTGPKVREWGFWCAARWLRGVGGIRIELQPERFVHWRDWDYVGGCGEL